MTNAAPSVDSASCQTHQLAELPDRFWAKVQQGPGCWLWTGARNSAGYGHVKLNGRMELVHRAAFAHFYGYWPIVVLHCCDTEICVCPTHLRGGDHTDNMRDMAVKGRGSSGVQLGRAKPRGTANHCPAGHVRTPENTYVRAKRGSSECLPCRRSRAGRRRKGAA